MKIIITVIAAWVTFVTALENLNSSDITRDGEESRKILGSSVVTSVSVVMDSGNGSKTTLYTDALGKPLGKPPSGADLASPIDLLNPDRYEFYTFDDNGELIKRLMSLDEIKGIIATGDTDGLVDFENFAPEGYLPEKRVNEVVNTVQNVLKSEIETHKNTLENTKPMFDTPDVSDTWSMILPAVFGNSGEDIKLEKPTSHITPDTIMIEPTSKPSTSFSTPRSTTVQISNNEILTKVPSVSLTSHYKETAKPEINVEIFSNSKITTPTTLGTTVDINKRKTSTTQAWSTDKPNAAVTIAEILKATGAVTSKPSDIGEIFKTTTSEAPTTTINLKPNSATTLAEILKTTGAISVTSSGEDLKTVATVARPSIATVAESKTTPAPPTTESLKSTLTDALTTTEFATEKFSTWRPDLSDQSDEDDDFSKLPTLAQILGYTNKVKVEETTTTTATTSDALSTFFTSSNDKTTVTTDKSDEDLSTLSSEYSAFKKPTTVLDQILTTNIFEINEELTTVKPEISTNEPFLITVNDNNEITTDRTLIGSIEQLLSQAVNNIEQVLINVNDTGKVQAMLEGTENKTLNENNDQVSTVASDFIETTTELSNENILLSQSLESLISQISNPVGLIMTTEAPATTTEKTEAKTDGLSTLEVTDGTERPNITEKIRNKADLSLEAMYEKLAEMAKYKDDDGSGTTNFIYPTTQQYETKSDTTNKFTTVVIIKRTDPPIFIETTTTTTTTEEDTTTVESTTEIAPAVLNETSTATINKTDVKQSTWLLVSTVAPHNEPQILPSAAPQFPDVVDPPTPIDLSFNPMKGFGLEDTTSNLDTDIYQFTQLCNELAFGFWKSVTAGLSSARSVLVSPFGATSLLAMVFLGARGATSGEMNEILKLDDMVTFNPHLIFKNVSESVRADEVDSGVATTSIVRELFSDRSKGKLLPFYKERARAFYDGFVEEVSFKEIGDIIRRRTNLQVKKTTGGKISEFLKDSSITARAPLAGININIFQTDCSRASTENRDGELHFVVLPSIRQRRLIPIPAVVYKSGFLAGYEPSLDATAISIGNKDKTVSTIFVMPGQQGVMAPGDGLMRLEKRLVESSFKKGAWSRLLRSLIPRSNLDVQIPRFSHKSVINASSALQKMGLHELFDIEKADLRGLNGIPNELFLSDVIQINSFATCGEKTIAETHHSEIYPAGAINARRARHLEQYLAESAMGIIDYRRAFHDPLHDPTTLNVPLSLRPRQARVPDVARLKFDKPFLYFVRHNPTGLILHMGRFNPRLLP